VGLQAHREKHIRDRTEYITRITEEHSSCWTGCLKCILQDLLLTVATRCILCADRFFPQVKYAIIIYFSYSSGFKLQATILMHMFGTIESGAITVPLWDSATVQDPTMTNQRFMREYIVNLLRSAFPNLSQ
jgi:hypothetical protein